MLIQTNNISTKSYTAVVLSMFSNLQIEKADLTLYQIPIKYASASRLYKKLQNSSQEITYRTPIMSLMEVNGEVNLERGYNRLLRRKQVQNIDGITSTIHYNPIPYDLKFELTLIADTLTSMSAIKEAIFSKFHNNVSYVDYISFLGEVVSTPVIMKTQEFDLENNEEVYDNDRILQIKFDLTVEGIFDNLQVNTPKKITEIDLLIEDYNSSVNAIIDSYKIV